MTHPLLATRRRLWSIIVPGVVAALLAVGWAAAWRYAAALAEERISAWRADEAKSGRFHSCARQTVNGFPFRIAVRCANAVTELRNADPPLTIKVKEIQLIGRVYDVSVSKAEVKAPLIISEPTRLLWTAGWSQASVGVHGLPRALDRLSVAIEEMRLDQPGATLMSADRLNFDARIAMGSARHNPVLELGLQAAGAVVSAAYMSNEPADFKIAAVLRGLRDLSPQRAPLLLRQLQAADGRLEIVNGRLQQGHTIATAVGALGLSANGRPEGNLRLTIAGAERLVQALGLDKALAPMGGNRGALGLDRGGPAQNGLDRLIPGLGGLARTKAAEKGLQMGIALLGEGTELEGRRATAIALRFTDGAAMLGPLKLGQIPPLY